MVFRERWSFCKVEEERGLGQSEFSFLVAVDRLWFTFFSLHPSLRDLLATRFQGLSKAHLAPTAEGVTMNFLSVPRVCSSAAH